ncbi:MAG: FAD-binding protein, partial [Actinobacteria bacterium]|nr:FAD-binding protein [Actinomycetota bacterium]
METTDGSTTVRGSSRRDFLKGAAVSAAGIVGASLLSACAAKTDSSSTAVAATETAASTSGNVAGYCGPGDWLGEAPAIADADITSDETYDVVIFGSGHSGVGAAMAAADKGLKVAVVEKQAWSAFVDLEGTGDNMAGWYGEDIGHVNSQFLIDRGFGPYNTGEIALEFCKRGGNGRVNPDIIKAFIQNSGAMFDRYHEIYNTYEAERKANDSNVFMKGTMVVIDGEPVPDEGNFDMSNMFEYPLCNTQAAYAVDSYPINSGGYKTWPCNAQFYGYQGNNIEYIHKYIVQYAQENGATYYFEHTGIKLVQDESGAVTGLIAQNAEGKYIKLNATKGVILCSGDFIGNPAMCWALLNEGMEWGSRGGSTAEDWATAGTRDGIGHKMGVWAGGMIEPTPRGWLSLGGG